MTERTTAQTIAGLFGVAFIVLGVIGFIPEITTDYMQFHTWERHSHAELFGVFDVSVFQNAIHLVFGIAGLALSRTLAGAWSYLVGGGVALVDLAVYGLLIERSSRANFVPLDAAGCWLHLGLGIGMAAVGLASARAVPRALPA